MSCRAGEGFRLRCSFALLKAKLSNDFGVVLHLAVTHYIFPTQITPGCPNPSQARSFCLCLPAPLPSFSPDGNSRMLWHGSYLSSCRRIWFWKESGGRCFLTSFQPISACCSWTDCSIIYFPCFSSQDEILEDAAHSSQSYHTLAPCLHEMSTESRKETYFSYTKTIPYAYFMCMCASHIKTLPLP